MVLFSGVWFYSLDPDFIFWILVYFLEGGFILWSLVLFSAFRLCFLDSGFIFLAIWGLADPGGDYNSMTPVLRARDSQPTHTFI